MKRRKVYAVVLAAMLLLSALTGCGGDKGSAQGSDGSGESGAWEPDGPVTMIAAAAAGSGYDTSARSFAQLFNETGIVKQTIKVTNDSGANGQVGFTNFAHNYEGRGDALIAASTSSISIAVANEWEVSTEDFTPIAKLVTDAFTIVVNPDNTELDTIDKITARLKEDPGSITIGAAGAPDPDYIGLALYMQSIGVDINDVQYVVYEGGGEQLASLMGGHIDIAASSLSEFSAAVEAGQVKAVAVATEERMGGSYADTPTFREQGIDLVFGNWRGFWGPKNMPAEAVEYWRNAAKAAVETEEWTALCENMQWVSEPVIDDAQAWTEQFESDIIQVCRDAGIIE